MTHKDIIKMQRAQIKGYEEKFKRMREHIDHEVDWDSMSKGEIIENLLYALDRYHQSQEVINKLFGEIKVLQRKPKIQGERILALEQQVEKLKERLEI